MISMVFRTDGFVILCFCGKGFGDSVGFWRYVLVWRQHFGIPRLRLVCWESVFEYLGEALFGWVDWL